MNFEITIPVLNEEETLEQNIKILYDFVEKEFGERVKWAIVIADNGSTDRTAEIAKKLVDEFSGIKFVKVPERGVGLALKTSWSQSKADIVGYMDLDLATDLKHFPQVYKAIADEGFDIVYGTRLHKNSEVINRTFKREISSRIFNLILKVYLKVNFSDGMCGFKFLKREKYQQLYDNGAQNNGWFFSTELLTVGEWLGMKIYELPVKWTDDVSSSKVKVIPLAKKYLRAMRELKQRRKG